MIRVRAASCSSQPAISTGPQPTAFSPSTTSGDDPRVPFSGRRTLTTFGHRSACFRADGSLKMSLRLFPGLGDLGLALPELRLERDLEVRHALVGMDTFALRFPARRVTFRSQPRHHTVQLTHRRPEALRLNGQSLGA